MREAHDIARELDHAGVERRRERVGSIPAASRSGAVSRASAEARTSAARVSPPKSASLVDRSSSSRAGTGSGRDGSRS